MFCWLVGVVIVGEWSVVGLLVLAHTHTPLANRTSRWVGKMTIPIILLSPRRHRELFRIFPLTILHFHPTSHREMSRSSRRGSFLFGLTQQGGKSVWLSLMFSIEWYLVCYPSVFWGSGVNFPHAQVGSLFYFLHYRLCKFLWLHCWEQAIVFPHFGWLCLMSQLGLM